MGQVENRRVESHGYKVYIVSQVFRALHRTSCILFSTSSFSISRYPFCKSLVSIQPSPDIMETGENPAASELCSHTWRSTYPCRVYVFNNTKITSSKDISKSSRERSLAKTITAEQQEFLGTKTPLTDFYDLPDVNPHLN